MVVAAAFDHPERGRVRCPAAGLLAGSLRRAGFRPVRVDALSFVDMTGGGGTARVVSYVDRDEGVFGLAAAVPGVADAVLQAVDEWADVMRTRRIVLAAAQPWCSGMVTSWWALDRLLDEGRGPVYVLGDPPPCRDTAVGFVRRGAVFVDVLGQIPDGARVQFGPAGVSLAVRAEAKARGLPVTDATCPLVAAAADEVRRLAGQAEVVVLVADPAHAAVPGLVGQAPGQVTLVARPSQVATLDVPAAGGVGVVVEPGEAVADVMRVAERVRARFGHVVPQHPATLCHEPADRQSALRWLATDADVVLVAGAPGEKDGDAIVALLTGMGVPAHAVGSVEDVEPAWLRAAGCIGVTASLAAESGAVDVLVAALRGLGPTAVTGVDLHTRPISPSTVVPPRRRVTHV